MGQYYKPIILGEANLSTLEIIRFFLEALNYGNGMKLTEHSYIGNNFVSTFEYQLTPNGMFYKSRVVWAGDYADPEKDHDQNLSSMAGDSPEKCLHLPERTTEDYPYIVNHTKKQYVIKPKRSSIYETMFHPLPLLTAEGNTRGGGDYYGRDAKLIGIWARDMISVEKEYPSDYTELKCDFRED